MTKNRRIEDLIAALLESLAPRAKSLIVTIYGDAILPHGGNAWLGSLINLVEPFGLNERIVRTTVFRLSKEEWLTSTQVGRRSYYSLTETGRRRFEAAARRIYGPLHRPWNGDWSLVLLPGTALEAEKREELRHELTWMGFGAVGPQAFAHPDPDGEALRQLLQDLNLADRVVVLRGAADKMTPEGSLRGLVRSCWDLDQLAADYNEFLDRFRPVWRALEGVESLDPAACFAIRILLIHDYRRILLRDPMLPEQLLPPDWSGMASRLLCRNLYRLTQEPAERHLMTVLETAEGPLPEAAPYFYARFGGLADPQQEERATG